uniref:Secreted protein n=1 Tax=Arundo donax TaxID=35708 RepID=A0A0A9FKY5_ARUDO
MWPQARILGTLWHVLGSQPSGLFSVLWTRSSLSIENRWGGQSPQGRVFLEECTNNDYYCINTHGRVQKSAQAT